MNSINSIQSELKFKSLQSTSLKRQGKAEAVETLQKDYNSKLKNASDQFEEFFVHYMMKEMRKSSSQDNLLSGGEGEKVFQDMLDEKYAESATKNGGMGISNFLYNQLKR